MSDDSRFRQPIWINASIGWGSVAPPPTLNPIQMVGVPLCPDLLRYELIGEADGWRGRIVRAFFWLLRAWPASEA